MTKRRFTFFVIAFYALFVFHNSFAFAISFDFNSSMNLRREFWGEAPSCLSAGGECGGQRPWSVQPSARHKSPTAIEKFMGAVSSMLGNPDFFKNIGNLLKNIILNPGDLLNSVVGGVQRFFTRVNELIQQKGIRGALTEMITKMFDRNTQEDIQKAGGLDGFLSGNGTNTTFDGQSAKEFKIGGSTSIFTDLLGNMIGKTENGTTQSGEFGLNAKGVFGLITGKIVANLLGGGYTFAAEIQDGGVKKADVIENATAKVWASGTAGENGKVINIDFSDAVVESSSTQTQKSFNWSNFIMDLSQMGMLFKFGDNGKLNQVQQTVDSSSTSSDVSTRPLYAIANGIGNRVNGVPDYVFNLEQDLYSQSQNQIVQHRDTLGLPMYFPVTSNGTVNKGIDVLRVIAEGQIPAYEGLHAMRAQMLFEARFQGQNHRPVIAVGYSGGFVPMIEGLLKTPYYADVAGIVGLGAATFDIAKDTVDLIINLVHKIGSGIIEGVEDGLRLLSAPGEAIAAVLGFIRANTIDLALNKLREVVSFLRRSPISALPNIASQTNAEFAVNVWGSKDVLSEYAIGGYRQEMGGFVVGDQVNELFNVKIMGADHFNYMRDDNAPDTAWNLTVSNFVTRLLIASKDKTSLGQFLANQPVGVIVQDSDQTYVVNLPGHP